MLLHGGAGSRRGPGPGVVQVSEPADDVLCQPAKGWGGVAQVSELGEDVFGARTTECGARNADHGGSAECGVRPAGVCGVRSADRVQYAECGLQNAGPADVCGTRNVAEYCGVRIFVERERLKPGTWIFVDV